MVDMERKSNLNQSDILSEIKKLGILCYNKSYESEENSE